VNSFRLSYCSFLLGSPFFCRLHFHSIYFDISQVCPSLVLVPPRLTPFVPRSARLSILSSGLEQTKCRLLSPTLRVSFERSSSEFA
jgi:hypothetical protein